MLRCVASEQHYREDQQSYMLYPDRELPRFLDKNVIADNHGPGRNCFASCSPLAIRPSFDRNVDGGTHLMAISAMLHL